jgi:hypothetical protein
LVTQQRGTSANPVKNRKPTTPDLQLSPLKGRVTPEEIEFTDPLTVRQFTHVAQTATAIQVAWSHPSNFQKQVLAGDKILRQ